ncbi:MAG TPA: DNA polymerase III subunit chi [Methylophilaceae bacterium]|jgi:DNA polymerase-3 subunit chi
MTRIEFFFNVGDKLEKVVELSEKAVRKGRRLMLFAQDESMAREVGSRLWTSSSISFLPHCPVDHALSAETPIILDWRNVDFPHHDVLINLQADYPPFFSRFTRLIEIVGLDEEDRASARARYKFYRERGYELRLYDASGAAL